MAVVTISDEHLDFLKKLMTAVNTQDNRCTASPFYFCVRDMREVLTPEGCGEYSKYIDEEGSCIAHDLPGLRKYLAETYPEEIKDASVDVDLDLLDADMDAPEEDVFDSITAEALSRITAMDDLDVEMFAEEHAIRHVDYTKEPVYTGFFFTEEACEAHIAANKHHYHEPVSYVAYAFRNPELEQLLEALGALTGLGFVKH